MKERMLAVYNISLFHNDSPVQMWSGMCLSTQSPKRTKFLKVNNFGRSRVSFRLSCLPSHHTIFLTFSCYCPSVQMHHGMGTDSTQSPQLCLPITLTQHFCPSLIDIDHHSFFEKPVKSLILRFNFGRNVEVNVFLGGVLSLEYS